MEPDVAGDHFPPILHEALITLRAQRDTIGWPQRQQIAMDLGRHIAESGPSDAAIALATLLAQDPQPQVRKEVADFLPYLPEDAFITLAARLGQDPNAVVRSTATRVIARRQKTSKRQQQSRRDLCRVESSFAAMAKIHGTLAADKARRLADEQYETLVRTTLHDLKNIVSPITISTVTLKKQFSDGKPNAAKCIDLIEDMERQLVYLASFMEEMRNYAQTSDAERPRCRIADLVTEAVTMATSAVVASGVDPESITIRQHVPSHLAAPVIRHQVVMALIHLIKNACESFDLSQGRRHSGPREVQITAEPQAGNRIAISIRDTGPGIPAQHLAVLREFALGNSTKREHGGTGFGLPTAYRFASAHGGTITIDSTSGKGTLVVLTLTSLDDEPLAAGDESSGDDEVPREET
jgi:signal transduction histidine kinase